jgi:predicted peptidase
MAVTLKHLSIPLLALAIVAGPGCDDSLVAIDSNELAAANLTKGIHRREVSLGDGETMRYTVSVPALTFGRTYPLVVALHQAGQVITPYFSEAYLRGLVEPGLRDLNAIIIAPDMPDNSGSWTDKYSEEAISELVRKILNLNRSWPVEPDRVVITGYSAGGFGVWHLTDKYPGLFSAGIPMAADPIIGKRNGPDAVPLYVIHGEQDELFPYDIVLNAVNFLRDKGVPITFVTVEGESHYAIYSYVAELRGAVAWLENEVWGD